MAFDILLGLVGVMDLTLILFRLFDTKGREPYLCDFINKTLACIMMLMTAAFFQTWYNERDHEAVHLMSVWMTLIFIQGHSCMSIQKLRVCFLANINIDLDEIQHVATTFFFFF